MRNSAPERITVEASLFGRERVNDPTKSKYIEENTCLRFLADTIIWQKANYSLSWNVDFI